MYFDYGGKKSMIFGILTMVGKINDFWYFDYGGEKSMIFGILTMVGKNQ